MLGEDVEHKYTSNIIDRYRFMTLLPLTQIQLKSIGYVVSWLLGHTTYMVIS